MSHGSKNKRRKVLQTDQIAMSITVILKKNS